MKQFECHITIVDNPCFKGIREIVEGRGWKFSCIAGDPDLGAATYCYATRWFEDMDQAVTITHKVKDQFMASGLSVIRVKVEKVVHDARVVNGEWMEMR